MNKMMNKRTLKECILDRQNIYNAIYSMESYVFDKGLLDAESNVTLKGGDKDIIIPMIWYFFIYCMINTTLNLLRGS